MSNPTPSFHQGISHIETNQEEESRKDPLSIGAMAFLLEPDPEAAVTAELVDHPVELPQAQFEALLIDSECEV